MDSAAVYADGRLIISGDFATVSGLGRCGLARLYSDGSLDTSFDAGSAFPRCSSRIYPFPMTIQGDRKIIVSGIVEEPWGGGTVSYPKTVRLLSDGKVDTTFKLDPGLAGQFFPQPDGTYLMFDANLRRLNPDGTFNAILPIWSDQNDYLDQFTDRLAFLCLCY